MARLAVLIILAHALPATCKAFLRQVDTRAEVEASLLAELAATFRPSAKKDHITNLETALKPMYTAVPQEADGTLRHTVVRYVLHRFFAQRGWFIRGLEPGGKPNAQNSSAVADLQEWVPTFLQGFLEQLAGGRGVSLRELAILAATIEDLVHKETTARLELAFTSLELPLTEKLDDKRVREVLEVFMMIYMLGGNFTATGPEKVRRAHDLFTKQVKDWTVVQEWMHGIEENVHPGDTPLDFEEMTRVVEEIGAKYGAYNIKECKSLKSELLEVESQKAGRVRLPEFYKKGLKGVFEFNEKIEYLRILGAVDESDPSDPHVIVPNYVGSRPNCLNPSNFYAICCQNECEDLMTKLERAIGTELALPDQIIILVEALSTDTVEARRKLSTTLVQRLKAIAEANAGEVPLHGRLFAQWMHHAFPRECPFPHEDGDTNPQTPDEWMRETGQETAKASTEEINAQVQKESAKPTGAAARKHHNFAENELPWSEKESVLLPTRSAVDGSLLQKRGKLRTIATFAVVFSMASAFVWATKKTWDTNPHAYAAKPKQQGDFFISEPNKDFGKYA